MVVLAGNRLEDSRLPIRSWQAIFILQYPTIASGGHCRAKWKAEGRDHRGLALLVYRAQLCGTMMVGMVMMVNVMMSMRSECRSSRRYENHSKEREGNPLHIE
jgi:hypothetical protein